MIEALEFIVSFCFRLFLALVLGSLCALGIWVLIATIRSLRGRK